MLMSGGIGQNRGLVADTDVCWCGFRVALGPILSNKCKKCGALARPRASSFLLCRGAGKISHEAGEAWGGGNRNYLNVHPSFKVGAPGRQAEQPSFPNHLLPPGSLAKPGLPSCTPRGAAGGAGRIRPRWGRPRAEPSLRAAAGAERSPRKLLSLSRRRLRSLGAKRLSRWHAPVRGSFHPSFLNAASS